MRLFFGDGKADRNVRVAVYAFVGVTLIGAVSGCSSNTKTAPSPVPSDSTSLPSVQESPTPSTSSPTATPSLGETPFSAGPAKYKYCVTLKNMLEANNSNSETDIVAGLKQISEEAQQESQTQVATAVSEYAEVVQAKGADMTKAAAVQAKIKALTPILVKDCGFNPETGEGLKPQPAAPTTPQPPQSVPTAVAP